MLLNRIGSRTGQDNWGCCGSRSVKDLDHGHKIAVMSSAFRRFRNSPVVQTRFLSRGFATAYPFGSSIHGALGLGFSTLNHEAMQACSSRPALSGVTSGATSFLNFSRSYMCPEGNYTAHQMYFNPICDPTSSRNINTPSIVSHVSPNNPLTTHMVYMQRPAAGPIPSTTPTPTPPLRPPSTSPANPTNSQPYSV